MEFNFEKYDLDTISKVLQQALTIVYVNDMVVPEIWYDDVNKSFKFVYDHDGCTIELVADLSALEKDDKTFEEWVMYTHEFATAAITSS